MSNNKGMILVEIDNSKTKLGNFKLQELVEEALPSLMDVEKDNYTISLNPNIRHMEYIKYLKYVGWTYKDGSEERISIVMTRVPTPDNVD